MEAGVGLRGGELISRCKRGVWTGQMIGCL